MTPKSVTITLPLPLGMGSVNCYLLPACEGFVLIDTGASNSRKALVQQLEQAGCTPGKLRLIVLTHGDFDHTGSAAFLRRAYGAVTAMHADDAAMAQRGDMFANRKPPNPIIRRLVPLLTGFGPAERFTPDVLLEDGQSLAEYGLDACVVYIPGHSRGSIGILANSGDLFCGDLLENNKAPGINSIMDDLPAAHASLRKLQSLPAGWVYPGHGTPFLLREVSAQ